MVKIKELLPFVDFVQEKEIPYIICKIDIFLQIDNKGDNRYIIVYHAMNNIIKRERYIDNLNYEHVLSYLKN